MGTKQGVKGYTDEIPVYCAHDAIVKRYILVTGKSDVVCIRHGKNSVKRR